MDLDDSRPIWIQLVDAFRHRIVSGSGLTVTERTAGRFVTADAAVLDAVRRELAVGATDTFIAAVTAIGMDLAQAGETLAEQWPASTTDESGEPS